MTIKAMDQHIEISPDIAFGKPRIAGHRITVQDIVIWHDRMGHCADEIATDYNLSLADVHAALAYYFDHREEIDRSMREGEEYAKTMRARTPSLLRQRMKELGLDEPKD